jgi:hypothetical protein
LAFAVRRLANTGGGIVVVDGGQLLAELPLPVAGILSDAPLADVVAASEEVIAAARQLGVEIEAPFQLLAFLAVGDPGAEDHRPRPRRRRAFRARPAEGGMTRPPVSSGRLCTNRHKAVMVSVGGSE